MGIAVPRRGKRNDRDPAGAGIRRISGRSAKSSCRVSRDAGPGQGLAAWASSRAISAREKSNCGAGVSGKAGEPSFPFSVPVSHGEPRYTGKRSSARETNEPGLQTVPHPVPVCGWLGSRADTPARVRSGIDQGQYPLRCRWTERGRVDTRPLGRGVRRLARPDFDGLRDLWERRESGAGKLPNAGSGRAGMDGFDALRYCRQ